MPDRSADFRDLRRRHPRFVYESFSVSQEAGLVSCTFRFVLEPSLVFEPTLTFEKPVDQSLPDHVLQALVFHLGLIELLSYWKAACPPEILIKAGHLAPEQVQWWRQVYFHGLGEFWFLNGLQITLSDFVSIRSEGPTFNRSELEFTDDSLIPVGGGKDSLVTLDLERKNQPQNRLFFLNPTKAQWESAAVMGYPRQQIVVAERKLDPALFDLNRAGYLNGHTPFSALLAFVAVTAAALNGQGRILLSNERSADESTIRGTLINHQWSKSWMFEQMFHDYVQDWLLSNMDYASVLRPWSELQIAQQFCLPHNRSALQVFRSCNVGQKTDSWCGTCPKCLFVNIILAPFLSRPQIREIFGGAEPLDQLELQDIFEQLIGATETKPFECIGSIEEIRAALSITSRQPDPPLLSNLFMNRFPSWVQSPEEVGQLLRHYHYRARRVSLFG